MSNYTPGPWHLSQGTYGSPHTISWEPKKTYGHIATIPTPSFQELSEAKLAGEVLANATLIAAAPDLLEKLETAVAIIDMMMDAIEATPPEACQQDFIAMVETIKQARGEP